MGLLAASFVAGCSGPANSGDAGQDAGNDVSPGVDTGPGSDGGDSGVNDGSGGDGGGADAGTGVTVVATTTLPGVPVAMIHDPTANREYISLRMMGNGVTMYTGAGIAVIDTSNDTMVGMLPAPMVAGVNPTHPLMQVLEIDPAAHRLYAAGPGGEVFYFDTTALTLAGQFEPGGAGWTSATTGLALDAANHTLWVDCGVLWAVDTSTLMSTNVTTTIGPGNVGNGGSSLALDTMTHMIFQCGHDASFHPACQGVNTMTQTSSAPMAFTIGDALLGGQGVPGSAVAVTVPMSGPAIAHLLEPMPNTLPMGFHPSGFRLISADRSPSGMPEILLVGQQESPIGSTNTVPYVYVFIIRGESLVTENRSWQVDLNFAHANFTQFDEVDVFANPTSLDFVVSGLNPSESTDPGAETVLHLRIAP